MGWTFQRQAERADIIRDRTEPWTNDTHAGHTVRHCCKGNVLWTVRAIIDKRSRRIEWYIGCDLLARERGYGWGYKDMCESMHPHYYTCPLLYLDLVTIACAPWREQVRAYHAHRSRPLKIGTTYTLIGRSIPSISIVSLRPLIGRHNGQTYRVSRNHLGQAIEETQCPQT